MSPISSIILFSLAIAIGAGALTYRSFHSDIDAARSKAENGARVLSTAVGPLQYIDVGSGVPVLSIHGSGGGHDQGLDIAVDLIGREHRIIAPSRFGYLGTLVPADSSDAAQADTLVALLDALKIERVVVAGTSAGARSAIELALRHPDRIRALILIVPATYAPSSPVTIESSRASRLAFALVNAGADFAWWALERIAPSTLVRFLGVPPSVFAAAPKTNQERVLRIVRSVQPLSKRVRGINLDSVPPLRPPPLDTMRVPTLIVTARDDLFNTLPAAEFAAQAIPAATLVVFDTGGHLLVGREAEVRRSVGVFVDSVGDGHREP